MLGGLVAVTAVGFLLLRCLVLNRKFFDVFWRWGRQLCYLHCDGFFFIGCWLVEGSQMTLSQLFVARFDLLGLLDQYVWVYSVIAEVIECHDSARERSLLWIWSTSHRSFLSHNRLLKKLHRANNRINVHFPHLLPSLNQPNLILRNIFRGCFQIWVQRTVLRPVPHLLTTRAPNTATVLLVIIRFTIRISLVLTCVLGELTAWVLPICFATTPPDRPAPLRLMRPARPVEILFFRILFFTILACF